MVFGKNAPLNQKETMLDAFMQIFGRFWRYDNIESWNQLKYLISIRFQRKFICKKINENLSNIQVSGEQCAVIRDFSLCCYDFLGSKQVFMPCSQL